MRTISSFLIIFIALVLLSPGDAHAYLDPGTGSMLLSVVIGLVSTAYFALRKLPAVVRSFIFRLRGKTELLKRNHIVFYAESASYWNTFRPLLEEFGRRGTEVLYLTSAEKDPVFSAGLPECITPRFIGTGNTAYTALNFLEADVFVLTTPGIDVLQIRRSKGVRTYAHVVHAVADIHTYKLFSFDYYDSILCSGAHQVRSLRALEAERGTAPKELPIVGCAYMDGLASRAETAGEPEQNCVIVAPTWGRNGMLSRLGAAVPKTLAEAGFKVILRPHPQSFVSEKALMDKLAQELSAYPSVEWDRNPDGFASLSRAQVLISDLSGVIFDFAFAFLRPVVTLAHEPEKAGFEAFDIPHGAWEMDMLDQVGQRLTEEDVHRLADTVNRLIEAPDMKAHLASVRDANVANFGHAAGHIVDEISRLAALTGD